jgi:pyridoxal phosphate-dependent aminotransferase EpsN
MLMKSLVVVGAGRHGRVVAETALSTRCYEVVGFADEEPAKQGLDLGRWKVLGHWRDTVADEYVVGIGSNPTRQRIYESLVAEGRQLATVVSDRASVSADARVGRGSVVLAGAVVQSGAVIGENVVVNAGAVIDHDANVGPHAHVGPHSTVESFALVRPGEMVSAATFRPRAESLAPLPTVAEDEAILQTPAATASVAAVQLTRVIHEAASVRLGPFGPGHHRIRLSIPHMGGEELDHVRQAFTTNWLSTVGPNLTALEERFSNLLGRPSLAIASGTAGLHLALKLVGVGPGEEVVSPTLTFVASCNPILYEGARPVFLDSDRVSWNLDPQRFVEFIRLRARNGRLPKAVVVVHLFGQPADVDPVLAVCREHGIAVVEDAAEALGALYRGRPVGTLGDVGVFSFNGNKVITATSGGMLLASSEHLVRKARHWSTQACDPDPLRNYRHSEIGYNYRMSNVLAGIALGQLGVLDLRVQQRRAVFERYRTAFADLPGLEPQPEARYGTADHGPRTTDQGAGSLHTRWLSCFLVDEARFGMSAADLIRWLEAANVESRPVWKPMHTQPLYRGCECVGGAVAEDLNQRGICLPSSSSLSEAEQAFVIERVRAAHFR